VTAATVAAGLGDAGDECRAMERRARRAHQGDRGHGFMLLVESETHRQRFYAHRVDVVVRNTQQDVRQVLPLWPTTSETMSAGASDGSAKEIWT